MASTTVTGRIFFAVGTYLASTIFSSKDGGSATTTTSIVPPPQQLQQQQQQLIHSIHNTNNNQPYSILQEESYNHHHDKLITNQQHIENISLEGIANPENIDDTTTTTTTTTTETKENKKDHEDDDNNKEQEEEEEEEEEENDDIDEDDEEYLKTIYTPAALVDRIVQLPGLDPAYYPIPNLKNKKKKKRGGGIGFQQFAGYIDGLSSSRHLFYWYVESQSNPKTDPVVLWTNGGPGCSGLLGFGTEHGPFHIDGEGILTPNPYSWNRIANMIYIEQPAGVGFSYYDNPIMDQTTGDDQSAKDNYAFLLHFFTKFPERRSNPFYIASESYGGHYVPQLALEILRNDFHHEQINLSGILVGNPYVDPYTNEITEIRAYYNHGLIAKPLFDTWIKDCENRYMYDTDYCLDIESDMFDAFGPGINPYALDYPVCFEDVFLPNEQYEFNLHDDTTTGNILNKIKNNKDTTTTTKDKTNEDKKDENLYPDHERVHWRRGQQHHKKDDMYRNHHHRRNNNRNHRSKKRRQRLLRRQQSGPTSHTGSDTTRRSLSQQHHYHHLHHANPKYYKDDDYRIDDDFTIVDDDDAPYGHEIQTAEIIATTTTATSYGNNTDQQQVLVPPPPGGGGVVLTYSSQVDKFLRHSQEGGSGVIAPTFLPKQDTGYKPCSQVHLERFLNRHDVREALHVVDAGGYLWTPCSTDDEIHYSNIDFDQSVIPLYRELITLAVARSPTGQWLNDLNMLIYSGDDDSIASTAGTQDWIWDLGVPPVSHNEWKPWRTPLTNQTAGFVVHYQLPGNSNSTFIFATVHGAGHEVPAYRPYEALELFAKYLDRTL